MEMIPILLPIIFVGVMALFVVMRMKQKYKQGTLGKKNSTRAQTLLDSLIPLGMVIGCCSGMVLSFIFTFSISYGLSLGAALGLLGGYIGYEIYSREEESYS
ncbi:hypothetical protein SAMN04488053_10869 [Alkalicoccus daliensis]|uniref:Uncharacterized protein n=2 Tax=Alkalicoccus daliensis TaxID=745820 RepID=A0A1H0HE22_9BACI|nr:hypothetical protein SAMN04488053_10869 [Alkalicoccus daliensis]